MSDEQRNFIHLAKSSAQRHLSIMLSNPKLYLGSLQYGMDFVWGKLHTPFGLLITDSHSEMCFYGSSAPQTHPPVTRNIRPISPRYRRQNAASRALSDTRQ